MTETPTTPAPPPPQRTGRPTKRTSKVTRAILRGIAAGLPFKHAAGAAGVTGGTLAEWRRKFPDFDAAVEAALAKAIRHHLNIITTAANTGDWKAASWLLEHRFPEDFARSRVDVAHIGQVEHTFTIPLNVLDEIAAARKQQEEKRVEPERA